MTIERRVAHAGFTLSRDYPVAVERIWDAFAEYGVGVGAHGVANGKTATTVESFDLPAECEE